MQELTADIALELIGAARRRAETLDLAMQLARSDPNGRVRLHALRSVTDARGMDDEATLRLTGDRLTNDEDPLVREDA